VKPKVGDKVVGIIEWRDGTVIDVARNIIFKKSLYPGVKADLSWIKSTDFKEGVANKVDLAPVE